MSAESMASPWPFQFDFVRFTDLWAQGAVQGQRVFIRADLDLHGHDEQADERKLGDALECILMALMSGAALMVTGHRGRSREGTREADNSLAPIALRLGEILGQEVPLVMDWVDGVSVLPGQVVVLENCRLNVGERRCDEQLSRKMALLCDIYVNDALGMVHSQEATTLGIARFAKTACAGPRLAAALDARAAALDRRQRPLVAAIGGSSLYVKLPMLEALSRHVDVFVLGGTIANSFLAVSGKPIGRSLADHGDIKRELQTIMAAMQARGAQLILPDDVATATAFGYEAVATVKPVADVGPGDMILDVGPRSAERMAELLRGAGTIIWFGCPGVYEFAEFARGTQAWVRAIAGSTAYRIAGGADTVTALESFGVARRLEYVTSRRIALQYLLEDRPLPAVDALRCGEGEQVDE
jgi:phosphoglycerate kinase